MICFEHISKLSIVVQCLHEIGAFFGEFEAEAGAKKSSWVK